MSPVAVALLLLTVWARAQAGGPNVLRATLYRFLDRGAVDRPLWAGLTSEPSTDSRRLAVEVLASTADPSGLPVLQVMSNDLDFGVRREVQVAAGRIGPAADGLAQAGLSSSSPTVRRAAAWAACHTGAGAAVLGLLAREKDVVVLETALANLWRLDAVAWEAPAVAFATHSDPLLRRAVAYSLSRRPREAGMAALRALARDPQPVIRATALRGLGTASLSEADRALVLAAVSDADWRVQVEACRALEAAERLTIPAPTAATIRALWGSPEPHLAVSAVRVAGPHPEVGGGAELETLARSGAEPWLAGEALAALARRGGTSATRMVGDWVTSPDAGRRRAAAAALHWLPADSAAPLEKVVAGDREAAVRLAWLEAMPEEQAKSRVEVLHRMVAEDADPAVRAEALDLLRSAGAAGSVDELLERSRAWRDDRMGDARSTALAAALGLAQGAQRQEVLAAALADPDPAVVASVIHAARAAGMKVSTPPREPRHGARWYEDLVQWAGEEHWLDVVTVRGAFRVRLDAAKVPISAREISDLAASGFYDGLVFHRVVPNFVVQGGDPRGDGWGGPGFALPDEPSLEPFDAWRVGVATSGPNTGGSQLFITLMPADHLVGHYTNLGEVVWGREVLTRIRVGDRIVRVTPLSGPSPELPPPTLLGALDWPRLAEIAGWKEEADAYQPDPTAVARLQQVKGSYRVVAVLGTWCGDSEREVPRLHRVLEAVGGDRFSLRLIGVDRTKRVGDPGFPAELLPERTPERVPTILVLDDQGRELGRIVETAEKPLEQLLLDFVSPAEGW